MIILFTQLIGQSQWDVLRDDVWTVITEGSAADQVAYTVVFFILLLVLYIAFLFARFMLGITWEFMKFVGMFFTKSFWDKSKAQQYASRKAAFERKEKDKEWKADARKRAVEQKKKKKREKEEEQLRVAETIAMSKLDYSYFLPENGYTTGPNVEQRIEMESERMRQINRRLLTEQEIKRIEKGFRADGEPFASGTGIEDRLHTLFQHQKKHGYVGKVMTKPSNTIRLPKRQVASGGEIISFPKQRK